MMLYNVAAFVVATLPLRTDCFLNSGTNIMLWKPELCNHQQPRPNKCVLGRLSMTKYDDSPNKDTLAQDAPNGETLIDGQTDNDLEGGKFLGHQELIDVKGILNSILRVAASTDRGQYANVEQKEQISENILKLETSFISNHIESRLDKDIADELTGTWELLYSNVQLFRSSPFFLSGRTTCRTQEEVQLYQWFCDMHRAALAISNIGVVRQIIQKNGRMINEFEVKAGAVPFLSDFLPQLSYSGGLPVTIDGAIVSSADIISVSSETSTSLWEIYMDTVEIKGSNIPFLRTFLDSESAKLETRELSKLLEDNVGGYETPRPVLRTTYVDEGIRIVRDEDDNVFIYSCVSKSEEPTDYSKIMPDLGVALLLERFNDAVTKLYL